MGLEEALEIFKGNENPLVFPIIRIKRPLTLDTIHSVNVVRKGRGFSMEVQGSFNYKIHRSEDLIVERARAADRIVKLVKSYEENRSHGLLDLATQYALQLDIAHGTDVTSFVAREFKANHIINDKQIVRQVMKHLEDEGEVGDLLLLRGAEGKLRLDRCYLRNSPYTPAFFTSAYRSDRVLCDNTLQLSYR